MKLSHSGKTDAENLAARAYAAIGGLRPQLLINGKWQAARRGGEIAVHDPATEAVIAQIAAGEADDIDLAVQAAHKAVRHGSWSRMTGSERSALLNNLADLVEQYADEIAMIEAVDTGSPYATVRAADISMAIAALRENASWANKIIGDVPMTERNASAFAYMSREPVGVVGVVTPWNAPFLMALKKASAALAAGCAVVLKPAELAPLSSLRLGQLMLETGFPDGAFNIVTGTGSQAGQPLVDHDGVQMISFTGSTRVGRSIVAGSAKGNMKRFVLELGGKSPVLLFADADLDRAVASIAAETVFKSGQYCGAGTRLFIEEPLFDDIVQAISQKMSGNRLGHALAPGTTMGPLISFHQRDRVERLVSQSVEKGALIHGSGVALPQRGHFYSPSVVTGVKKGFEVYDEEVFGPVICAVPFASDTSLEELAGQANDTEYGLAAKLWTTSAERILRLPRLLEAGNVMVNGGGGEKNLPFGGFKQSGMGREGGREGVNAFTEIKTIRIGI